MDVRTLEYFVLVAEEGSISAGARRAMVAQPAVSVALRKLERDVGAPLLERSHGGIELTVAGHTLFVQAQRVLRCMAEARDETRRSGARGRAVFTVGLTSGQASAGELTGPILQAFRTAHPELDLRVRELDFAGQFDEVLHRGVDLALVRAPYEHDDLVMEPLFTEPTVLVVSPEHLLAELPEVSLDALGGERLLEVVRAPEAWRAFWSFAGLRTEQAGIPTEELGLIGYCMDVLKHGTVSPMALSGWRLGGLGAPTIRAVRLTDAPRSVVGVGYRASARQPEIRSFVDIARAVTAEMVALVPEAAPAMAHSRPVRGYTRSV
ncbi:LysR family transcriptional regulator [Pseudonocardia spinosispora]|uniref:LysR family transcriptional regulator n=1 Tax=Pseudonocardia spinosispora TaxID=103441 RepID=UPI00040EB41B|nr:LysR family transcriptional regulator [Pseudonocardia spinosispora]